MANPAVDETIKKLGLPPKNNLIASNLQYLPDNKEYSKMPILLKKWPKCTDVWYKKDHKFKVPKVVINL